MCLTQKDPKPLDTATELAQALQTYPLVSPADLGVGGPTRFAFHAADGFNQLKKIVQTHQLMGFTRGEGIHEKPQRHELYSRTGIVLA